MSDADDQLGGTGGDRGTPPDEVRPGVDNAAPVDPTMARNLATSTRVPAKMANNLDKPGFISEGIGRHRDLQNEVPPGWLGCLTGGVSLTGTWTSPGPSG